MPEDKNPFDEAVDRDARESRSFEDTTNSELQDLLEQVLVQTVLIQNRLDDGIAGRTV